MFNKIILIYKIVKIYKLISYKVKNNINYMKTLPTEAQVTSEASKRDWPALGVGVDRQASSGSTRGLRSSMS